MELRCELESSRGTALLAPKASTRVPPPASGGCKAAGKEQTCPGSCISPSPAGGRWLPADRSKPQTWAGIPLQALQLGQGQAPIVMFLHQLLGAGGTWGGVELGMNASLIPSLLSSLAQPWHSLPLCLAVWEAEGESEQASGAPLCLCTLPCHPLAAGEREEPSWLFLGWLPMEICVCVCGQLHGMGPSAIWVPSPLSTTNLLTPAQLRLLRTGLGKAMLGLQGGTGG